MESSPHFFFMTTPLGWSVNSFFDKIVFSVHIFIFPRDPRATAKRVKRTRRLLVGQAFAVLAQRLHHM